MTNGRLNEKEADNKNKQQPVEPKPREEFIREQEKAPDFREYSQKIVLPTLHFNFDQNRYLICMSPLDGALQKSVPKSLCDRVIELSHKPITAGHPGDSRLFQTIRAEFYCPFMASYLIHHAKHCRTCVNAKVIYLTDNTNFLCSHQEDLYMIFPLTYSDHFRKQRMKTHMS